MIKVTVIVLTHNESANMAPCLEALATVDDVVIVDSGSTDGTIQAARSVRPSVRVYEHPFKDFGDQRNWAIDNAEPKHNWVLFVDADEYCDPELLEEIREFISDPAGDVGGYIAGRNYFLGQWLKRSTMYPSFQLRLLKLGEIRYRKEGHGQREVTSGSLRYLRHGWRHESFSKGVHQWIDRHNTYSTEEAQHLLESSRDDIEWSLAFGGAVERRRFIKSLAARLPLRPWLRYFYTLVIKGGFLDGKPGFLYSSLLLSHQLNIRAKLSELRRKTVLSQSE